MTNAVRALWSIILVGAGVVLSARLIIAFGSAPSIVALPILTGIIVCMYSLFLLEGLQHCAIQINDADEEGVNEYISANVAASHRDQVTGLAKELKSNFELFLTGRNICSMVSIVLIAYFIDVIPLKEDNFVYNSISNMGPKYLVVARYSLHSFIAIFLLSTLLPCWIAQLLPQLLADQKSINFIQLPFARYATNLAIWVARMEVGWPSELLYLKIQSINKFKTRERFRIGGGTLFERLADIFGQAVSERNIHIDIQPESITIIDAVKIVFTRVVTSNVRHSVKVPQDEGFVQVEGWDFKFPEGVRHDKPRASTVPIYTAISPGSDHQLESLLLSFETSLESPLPREGYDKDFVDLGVKYKQRPPSLNPDLEDEIFVYVSKPTKIVKILITTAANVFAVKPTISYQIYDESSGLVDERTQTPAHSANINRTDGGWSVIINHPPLNSRFLLLLDARFLNPEAVLSEGKA